jgi:hypothetical protein
MSIVEKWSLTDDQRTDWTAAILVLPGDGPAAVRVVLANVDAGTLSIEPGPGIEVEPLPPRDAADG